METENVTTAPLARIWWRDFGYYTLRWTIILGVLSAIYYTEVPPSAPTDYFWHAKVLHLVSGPALDPFPGANQRGTQ
jgi:hypothetical protein